MSIRRSIGTPRREDHRHMFIFRRRPSRNARRVIAYLEACRRA